MQVIKVIKQPEKPFKAESARDAWWDRVQKFDGKSVEEFVADVTKNPPSLQPNGKFGKAGKVEPPMGWVGYFTRTELVKIEEVADKPAPRKKAPAKKRTTKAA